MAPLRVSFMMLNKETTFHGVGKCYGAVNASILPHAAGSFLSCDNYFLSHDHSFKIITNRECTCSGAVLRGFFAFSSNRHRKSQKRGPSLRESIHIITQHTYRYFDLALCLALQIYWPYGISCERQVSFALCKYSLHFCISSVQIGPYPQHLE